MKNNISDYDKSTLDLMRVIATISVILIHSSGEMFEFLNNMSNLNIFAISFYNSISRIAVPTFLILSGMLLLNRQEAISIFYIKRFIALAPIFIIWNVIFAIYKSISYDTSFIMNFLSLLKGPIFYHLWYIYTLIGIYITTPLLRVLYQNKDRDKDYIFYFLVIAFSINIINAFSLRYLGFKSGLILGISCELLYFLLGGLIVDIAQRFKNPLINAIVLTATSLVISIGVYRYNLNGIASANFFNSYYNIFNLIQTLSFIFFLMSLDDKIRKLSSTSKKRLGFISKHSLNIYFSHALILTILIKNFTDIYTSYNQFVSIAISVIIVFLLSLFISYILNIGVSRFNSYLEIKTRKYTKNN